MKSKVKRQTLRIVVIDTQYRLMMRDIRRGLFSFLLVRCSAWDNEQNQQWNKNQPLIYPFFKTILQSPENFFFCCQSGSSLVRVK